MKTGFREVQDDPAPPPGWLGQQQRTRLVGNPDFFFSSLVISVVVSQRYRRTTRVLERSHTSGLVTIATSARRPVSISELASQDALQSAAWKMKQPRALHLAS